MPVPSPFPPATFAKLDSLELSFSLADRFHGYGKPDPVIFIQKLDHSARVGKSGNVAAVLAAFAGECVR